MYALSDFASAAHESVPLEVLRDMHLERRVADMAGRGLRGFLARRWLRGKDPRTIARMVDSHRPKDVLAQQEEGRNAEHSERPPAREAASRNRC